MTDDIPERLRAYLQRPGITEPDDPELVCEARVAIADALVEIERLRARNVELEAQLAATLGTFAKPAEDEPATYTHDVPPNAPR